jgi:hypothetical protein
MELQLDTLPKIIVAGITLLGSTSIFVFPLIKFFRWFFVRGGRLAAAGAAAQLGGKDEILAKLDAMEEARRAAVGLANRREQLNQEQWKRNFVILDGVVTALHESGIGNGNLSKAQKALAECEDARDKALVDQIGGS